MFQSIGICFLMSSLWNTVNDFQHSVEHMALEWSNEFIFEAMNLHVEEQLNNALLIYWAGICCYCHCLKEKDRDGTTVSHLTEDPSSPEFFELGSLLKPEGNRGNKKGKLPAAVRFDCCIMCIFLYISVNCNSCPDTGGNVWQSILEGVLQKSLYFITFARSKQ